MKTEEPRKPVSFELKHQWDLNLPTHCLSMALRGDQIYTACLDGGIYRQGPGAENPKEVGRHESYASGVSWSEENGVLISAGYDGKLHWIDPDKATTSRTVSAHDFWSWQSSISPDGRMIASSTGQYLCGGYKYEPAPEREPSVKVFEVSSGKLLHGFPHVPPVESVAFSNDGKFLAAGNLMGEVRVWDLETGVMAATWTTPSFTGWGIIKGHYYTGGIFSIAFAPGDESIYLAGMGSTRDPAAGNGKQLWEKFSWRNEGGPEKESSAGDGEIGQGLMETLAFHPGGKFFVMAGRLFKGKWNCAVFNAETGRLVHSLNTKMRVSMAVFSADGSSLYLAGGVGQGKKDKMKDGKFRDFGRVRIYQAQIA